MTTCPISSFCIKLMAEWQAVQILIRGQLFKTMGPLVNVLLKFQISNMPTFSVEKM